LHLLLDDPSLPTTIGKHAREWVRNEFIGDRHLVQYVDLFDVLIN
jgi:hypothetical protein